MPSAGATVQQGRRQTGFAVLGALDAVSNVADAAEVALVEHGVVVHHKGGSLQRRKARPQQRGRAMLALVQAEVNAASAGIVRILDELLGNRRALRVVEQDLPAPLPL